MITIGIVEDETNLRDIVKGYLEKEGYKVYAFPSAEEARDYLDYEIHLWILDIMLPGQNGLTLWRMLRRKVHRFLSFSFRLEIKLLTAY